MQDSEYSVGDSSDLKECNQHQHSEDTGIIHTSDIRFMGSSDGVDPFASRNPDNSNDRVDNYLRNYAALVARHFPPYSTHRSSNHSIKYGRWTPKARRVLVRSASMASVSESSLGSQMPERRAGCRGEKYIVMQATVVPAPTKVTIPVTNELNKMTNSSLDHRMQKVLGTLQEDPRGRTGVSEKPQLEHSRNLTKISTAEAILPLPSSPITSGACALPEISRPEIKELSNRYRNSFYNPYTQQREVENYNNMQSVEPPPLLQLFPCSTKDEDKTSNVKSEPVSSYKLIPLRSPLLCPECEEYAFVSDFNKHMVLDHPNLPNMRISPGQHKNFFLDPRASCFGANRCHLLYLIRDKVKDLGSSEFKDYLPMLVMSSRVRLGHLCDIAEDEKDNFNSMLLIWLTGMVPEGKPLCTTLTAYRPSEGQPMHYVSHSSEIYSIRNSQDAMDVFWSGQRLVLSDMQLRQLTSDGKDMLELQVLVN